MIVKCILVLVSKWLRPTTESVTHYFHVNYFTVKIKLYIKINLYQRLQD